MTDTVYCAWCMAKAAHVRTAKNLNLYTICDVCHSRSFLTADAIRRIAADGPRFASMYWRGEPCPPSPAAGLQRDALICPICTARGAHVRFDKKGSVYLILACGCSGRAYLHDELATASILWRNPEAATLLAQRTSLRTREPKRVPAVVTPAAEATG